MSSLFLRFIVGDIIQRIIDSSGYEQRKSEVSAFNATNRWKKRGLSLVPMLYGQYDYTAKFHILLSIYQGDGTISISCGAVEMGQGKKPSWISTHIKNVYFLQIPIEYA